MNELDTLLREEIRREFKKLKEEDLDDQQYKTVVDGLTKLMDRETELLKLNLDERIKDRARDDSLEQAEFERELKEQQAEEARAMAEFERQFKLEQAELDRKLKLEEIKSTNKLRIIGILVDVAGIILPLTVTIWGTKKSIEFEREGTFTTIMGRGFINKLLPKK